MESLSHPQSAILPPPSAEYFSNLGSPYDFYSFTQPLLGSNPSADFLHLEESWLENDSFGLPLAGDQFVDSSANQCHSHGRRYGISLLDGFRHLGERTSGTSRLGLFVPSSGSISPPTMQTTVSPQLLFAPAPITHIYTKLDTEDTSESDEDTDSEYTPSPLLTLKRRISRRRTTHRTSASNTALRFIPRQSSRTTCPTRSSSSSSSSRQSSLEACNTAERHRPIRTAPRRAQREGTPNYDATNAEGDFSCEVCEYTCKPHRRIDFRRHVNTHYPHMIGGPTTCCGIPVGLRDLPEWHEQFVKVAGTGFIRTFNGRRMVGGCGKVFSRTDALIRHLASTKNPCVGDPDGDWHPPRQRDYTALSQSAE